MSPSESMHRHLIRRLLYIVWPRRAFRATVLAAVYAFVIGLSFWVAYLLRFDFDVPPRYQENLLGLCCFVIGAKLACMAAFHQFDGLLTYFATPDLRRLFAACASGSLLVGALRYATDVPPRGVILTDFVLCLGALCVTRLSFRYVRAIGRGESPRAAGYKRRVAIVGAGDTGAMLARELFGHPGLGLEPVAFFDDGHGRSCSVHGLRVVGPAEDLRRVKDSLQIKEVIIAMPSAPAKRVREIVKIVQAEGLVCRTVPSLQQLATGQMTLTNLRPVQIEDLLGRIPVEIEISAVWRTLRGQTVMVTGAGGSIGSELCRQVLTFGPAKLLLVERSEPHLFAIEQELRTTTDDDSVKALVGDITRPERMRELLRRYEPDVIFHAAAHKHVPMMEAQPEEAIRNNVLGTALLADLAIEYGVARFVFISTDKAVNPTSVMGATKRFAELYLQSLTGASATKFMAVRFGNVLGSSGSVVPTFTRQIAAGGPLTVTHPEVTRFFMTIPEAVTLVLQSFALGKGGEIFVLDMGNPVRIVDLALQMISLSGLTPHQDIEIAFTGLRPGEKLYEELSHRREDVGPTEHPKVRRLLSAAPARSDVRRAIDEIAAALTDGRHEPESLKRLLSQSIPEYTPFFESAAEMESRPSESSISGPFSAASQSSRGGLAIATA